MNINILNLKFKKFHLCIYIYIYSRMLDTKNYVVFSIALVHINKIAPIYFCLGISTLF